MIYLDYSATTPVDRQVLDTFNKVCMEYPGNSNSLHSLGVKSKSLEDYATEEIAKMLKVKKSEIIYTSGLVNQIIQLLREYVKSIRIGVSI